MLEGLLHHKKEPPLYYAALTITERQIDAALWEGQKDGKVKVIKIASEKYTEGDWENAITASDKAISAIEEGMPEGIELTKVVFGLNPDWLIEDKIKEIYLKKLKQLTARLSLTALGFVELPTAISYYLQKEENAPQTVIMVGIENRNLIVSLFKIGKLIGNQIVVRGGDISLDLEKALTAFTDVEVLPSRILLYGTDEKIEEYKTAFLNYPWQKKANFLHFPKIEILNHETVVKAVAISSAHEITSPVGEEADNLNKTNETISDSGTSEEVAEIAEDLGFVSDRDIGASDIAVDLPRKPQKIADVDNIEPVVSTKSKFKFPFIPRFSFKKFQMAFKIPRFSKFSLLGIISGILLLVFGVIYAVYWYYPKGEVSLLVSTKTFAASENVTVDLNLDKTDVEKKILPGKEIQAELSNSKSIPTTGKKTVGDKAKGEITIYNKVANSKTFKKGTVVESGKLKFTLDSDVTIASASENIGSLTYGTNKATITAADIGQVYNLGPGTEFSFEELPQSSYSGRNEKALSGGSSREVMVVARDDQKNLKDQLTQDLIKQATEDINKKNSGEIKLLVDSITTKINKEIFSKEIGEEADSISLDLTVTAAGITYKNADLTELLDRIIAGNIPEGYEYKKDQIKITTNQISESQDKTRAFKINIEVALLPKVEFGDLTGRVAGLPCQKAIEYIESQKNVSGAECEVMKPFFLFKDRLPANPKNIKITLATL